MIAIPMSGMEIVLAYTLHDNFEIKGMYPSMLKINVLDVLIRQLNTKAYTY
jgi:hypothetical protein